MSARRPNYTAVADGTAPDFELTTTQRSSDNQPAQDDRSRGESSTRNPLVENSDTDDENDVEKGTETTAPKEVEEEMMDLRCLDLQGKTFKVRVPASSTIRSLKATLEKTSGHAAGRQRLIYGGRQLSDDNQSLLDAKVKPNTVVHLFVRPLADSASAQQGAEGAGLLPETSETVAVGGSRGAQLAAVTMPHGTTGNDGGGGAVAMEMSFSGDTDLQEYRARVKVLASLLLIVSVMNSLTLAVYLLDAIFSRLDSGQWFSLCLEAGVNVLGVAVGLTGLRGAATLDQEQVSKYCQGLVLVGVLYVATDVFGVIRAVAAEQPGSSNAGGGDNGSGGKSDGEGGGDDAATSNGDGDPDGVGGYSSSDAVSTAVTSLFFTVCIWGFCFYRAFQFQRHLRRADLDAEEINP